MERTNAALSIQAVARGKQARQHQAAAKIQTAVHLKQERRVLTAVRGLADQLPKVLWENLLSADAFKSGGRLWEILDANKHLSKEARARVLWNIVVSSFCIFS